MTRTSRIGRSLAEQLPIPVPGLPTGSTSAAGVVVTPGYSNTPGAWTELIAAVTGEAQFVQLAAVGAAQSGVALGVFLDLAVGGAGSEVAVVSSWPIGGANASAPTIALLPVCIPAGARISCRLTSSAAASTPAGPTIRATTYASANHHRSPSKLVTIGADTGTTYGSAVTASNTWTEVGTATQSFMGFVPAHQTQDAGVSGVNETISYGVGASGSELTVMTEMTTSAISESWYQYLEPLPVWRHIASGVRFVAKSTAGANNNIGVVILGIPYT